MKSNAGVDEVPLTGWGSPDLGLTWDHPPHPSRKNNLFPPPDRSLLIHSSSHIFSDFLELNYIILQTRGGC